MTPHRFALLVCVSVGCAHPPPPPAPAAPPATALDLLLEHQRDLGLRAPQVQSVKAVSARLKETNAPLQKELDAIDRQAARTEDGDRPPPPAGGRGMRGGGGRMGMGMGMGGGRGRGMGPGGGPGGSGRGGGRPAAVQKGKSSDRGETLRAEMAANHAAAVTEVWTTLDESQKEPARQLLLENDFDPP